jgi:hypothetical protein
MRPAMIQTIMHVAPKGNGFGIRLRMSRVGRGVWLGEGWNDKNAAQLGAATAADGWEWKTAQEAETAMTTIMNDVDDHGFKQKVDA